MEFYLIFNFLNNEILLKMIFFLFSFAGTVVGPCLGIEGKDEINWNLNEKEEDEEEMMKINKKNEINNTSSCPDPVQMNGENEEDDDVCSVVDDDESFSDSFYSGWCLPH